MCPSSAILLLTTAIPTLAQTQAPAFECNRLLGVPLGNRFSAFSRRDGCVAIDRLGLERQRFPGSRSPEVALAGTLRNSGLLAARFGLKLHRETREIPVFALVVGKGGPKLPLAKDDTVNGGLGEFGVGTKNLFARGGTMPMFALILTNNVDRPVVDKTGLTGH